MTLNRQVLFTVAVFALLVAVAHPTALALEIEVYEPTGSQPVVVSPQGKVAHLYKESHALLISASDYTKGKGWRNLPSTTKELDLVAEELQRHGFRSIRASNPTGEELYRLLRDFVATHGMAADTRIVVMFSGHGYTNKNADMGYIVPIDAGDPISTPHEFYSRAMPIRQLELFARELQARHALFVFDSCFSGSIFASRSSASRPEVRGSAAVDRWRFLREQSAQPLRQFIAAGGADEEVPARSQFVPLLLNALRGAGTREKDGYITSKEIGQYIEQLLPTITGQSPHSDVIRDASLVLGDMVFQLPGSDVHTSVSSTARQPNIGRESSDQSTIAQPRASTDSSWGRSLEIMPESEQTFKTLDRDPFATGHTRRISTSGGVIYSVLPVYEGAPKKSYMHVKWQFSDGSTIDEKRIEIPRHATLQSIALNESDYIMFHVPQSPEGSRTEIWKVQPGGGSIKKTKVSNDIGYPRSLVVSTVRGEALVVTNDGECHLRMAKHLASEQITLFTRRTYVLPIGMPSMGKQIFTK